MEKAKKEKLIEEKEMRFCPKCKSEDISMNMPDAFSASQGHHPGWICNDCGLKLSEFPFKNKTNNCIFCKILKGEIPAVKIWEDGKHFAFLDMNPINAGHTLLIPKKHSDYLFELNDEDYKDLMLKTKSLAKLLKKKLKPKRVGIIVEGFLIPHVHVHLVPLNNGGELSFEKAKPMSKEELKKIAERIRG